MQIFCVVDKLRCLGWTNRLFRQPSKYSRAFVSRLYSWVVFYVQDKNRITKIKYERYWSEGTSAGQIAV